MRVFFNNDKFNNKCLNGNVVVTRFLCYRLLKFTVTNHEGATYAILSYVCKHEF